MTLCRDYRSACPVAILLCYKCSRIDLMIETPILQMWIAYVHKQFRKTNVMINFSINSIEVTRLQQSIDFTK